MLSRRQGDSSSADGTADHRCRRWQYGRFRKHRNPRRPVAFLIRDAVLEPNLNTRCKGATGKCKILPLTSPQLGGGP